MEFVGYPDEDEISSSTVNPLRSSPLRKRGRNIGWWFHRI